MALKKQIIILSQPVSKFKIVKVKPKGSKELKGFETRAVKVFEKDGKRFIKAKTGFVLRKQ